MTMIIRAHRRAAGALCAVLACLMGTGCVSGRSRYPRTSAAPHELVWSFDGRLCVLKDGVMVGREGNWKSLPEAVADVPESREMAQTAIGRARTASRLKLTGAALLLGGPPAGLLLAGESDDNDAIGVVALTVFFGGIIGGLSCLLGSQTKALSATASAMDAVNSYNSILLNGRNPVPARKDGSAVAGRAPARADTVEVRTGKETRIFGGMVSVTRRRGVFEDVLVFDGIAGLSSKPDGGFTGKEVECAYGREFFIVFRPEERRVGKILSRSNATVVLGLYPL